MVIHKDCFADIRDANARMRHCVGWNQSKSGWIVYDPTKPVPRGIVPEFFCVSLGYLPVPLTEEGVTIMCELLVGKVREHAKPRKTSTR